MGKFASVLPRYKTSDQGAAHQLTYIQLRSAAEQKEHEMNEDKYKTVNECVRNYLTWMATWQWKSCKWQKRIGLEHRGGVRLMLR